jgi:hypothetical protein
MIWSSFSLAVTHRQKRLLVILQAFIDDSGNEPTSPVFVVAGVKRWVACSDEWDAVWPDDHEGGMP